MPKQKTVGEQSVYRPVWRDHHDVDTWLQRDMFVGETLNFPCGDSNIGDVLADADADNNPDVVADLWNLPFEENSFDTVYCDPPYHFYGGEQYHFVHPLWDIARERLIFQTNKVGIRLSKARKDFYILEKPHNPSVLIFQVFDQPNRPLTEYQGSR